MKSKLFLLIACFTVAFAGCKKDKTPEDKLGDIKKQIIGTWQVQTITGVGYDASGKEIDRETQNGDSDSKIQFVNETTVKEAGSDDTTNYSLSNTNGKIMLDFDGQKVELKIENGVMTWTAEQEANGTKYAKVVVTYQFKRV